MTDRSRSSGRLQFLGAQRIEIGAEVITPESERLFAMLVRLSVPLGRLTSRLTMLETIWPGSDEASGRHNLRQTVYKARELGLVVESSEDGLRLDPRHWTCDWDDPQVSDIAGGWLRDYDPSFSDELAAWVTSQRAGVHALIRPRIIRALQTARSAGDLLKADRHARQLLEIDTLNEEATLTRAELMAMQGAKVDALKLLDSYLAEIGELGAGRDAALPAQLLRRRIAEKLPAVSYQTAGRHHGPLVGRHREATRLTAALFDARAGRGAAVLVYGPDGSGKSRLVYEVRKSAVLQGMRVLELPCGGAPDVMPFATVRALVGRLLEYPGALGISPEALCRLRDWIASTAFAPTDCPLAELEDLLAAVSEETPLLLLVEHVERMDAESLVRLDRIYRHGVLRHHVMVLTTSSAATPLESPVELQWIERLPLRPLRTTEVRSILSAYAEVEQPTATSDEIAFCAVFAEGIPMYGIEMLGLMLDHGSPDVIPFRVRVALDRAVRELTELQCRLLALCGAMGACARQPYVATALQASPAELTTALDGLEQAGYIQCDEGVLRASSLLSVCAEQRVKPNIVRMDALRATEPLLADAHAQLDPVTFYTCLRLLITSGEEARARVLLDGYAGTLVRRDTAASIAFELERLSERVSSAALQEVVGDILARVNSGAQCTRSPRKAGSRHSEVSSLPSISKSALSVQYAPTAASKLSEPLISSRNPSLAPSQRLSEAATAMAVASAFNDKSALNAAFASVNAVRHSAEINAFDLRRADLIYHASIGDRESALTCAHDLVTEARIVRDVELACTGFRNASTVFAHYGELAAAQRVLHESRSLAALLEYHAQTASTDLNLAELCLDEMDMAGVAAYLDSADTIIHRHEIKTASHTIDYNLVRCWERVIARDQQSAQRAARLAIKKLHGAKDGTLLWTMLSMKLATFAGAHTRQSDRDAGALRSSIGSRKFYPHEQFNLCALLLYTRGTPNQIAEKEFVKGQTNRFLAEGRHVWPYLTLLLDE